MTVPALGVCRAAKKDLDEQASGSLFCPRLLRLAKAQMWSWLDEELERLEKQGLARSLLAIESSDGRRLSLGREQRSNAQGLINFASNDYLGLAQADVTRTALQEGISRWGAGAGASRLVTGNLGAHEEAEAGLAAYVKQPSALLFSSGYAANLSLLSALAGPGDLVFSDALNHASIIDGIRLSRAEPVVYGHCDIHDLNERLWTKRHHGGRKLIVTESVFSMDGDRAPLRALREVADRNGCPLIVDDAHAFGVLGERGSGLAAGIADVTVGTLGKAFGLWGAFVAGPVSLRHWLIHRARGFVFSTGVAPAMAHAVVRLLPWVEEADAARACVLGYAKRIAEAAPSGANDAQSAIVSWSVQPRDGGDDVRASLALESMLKDRGVLVRPMRPPTVPVGTSRLRIVPSAAHREQDIDKLLSALKAC